MVWQARAPETTVAEPPDVIWPQLDGCMVEVLEATEQETETLPSDTKIEKRRFTCAGGEWFLVTAVTGGRSKSSIHRPELCLPSQGFSMLSPRNAKCGGVDWRLITLAFKDMRPQTLAYTFFNQDGFRTASHTKRIFRDIVDRSFMNRIDRWVMLTVNASTADDASVRMFLSRLEGMVK